MTVPIHEIRKPLHITILGGGLAGVAAGYYAGKNGIPFTIHEARDWIGGNCITLKHGDFRFDSGAHRFHDKDPEITKELKELLGNDLRKIHAPSQIFDEGRLINFPLLPLNLLRSLGVRTFARAGFDLVQAKLSQKRPTGSFESFAIYTYGATIAGRFLLNYSEKLWGASCDKLSSEIAGTRMKGLNFRTFIKEAILGRNSSTEHVEGSFYYPKKGIGAIVEKFGELCGEENILKGSEITKILHNNVRIQAVEVNGAKIIDTDEVISTLPLNLFFQVMQPRPPEGISLLAQSLRYRNVVLVVLFINRKSITKASTVYFPNSDLPFTRICEPKNRSHHMAPPEQTSVVVEIPCQQEDMFWSMGDDELIHLIRSQLVQLGWIKDEEVIDSTLRRLHYAYPILEIGHEEKRRKIHAYLQNFSNLKLTGRNGRFVYAWIHDMIKFGKEIIEGYSRDHGENHSHS